MTIGMTDHCSFRRWAHHAITGTIIGSSGATTALSSCSLTIDFARESLVGYPRRPRGSHALAYGFIAVLVSVSRLHFAVGRSASFLCQSHFLATKDHLAMVIGSTFVDQGDLRHLELSGGCCRAVRASLLHTSAIAVPDTSILSD